MRIDGKKISGGKKKRRSEKKSQEPKKKKDNGEKTGESLRGTPSAHATAFTASFRGEHDMLQALLKVEVHSERGESRKKIGRR